VSFASEPRNFELAALVRSAHPEMSTTQRLAGWHSLRRRALKAERSTRLLRLVAGGLLIAGVGLGVGFGVGSSLASRSLAYDLSEGQLGEDGRLRVEAARTSTLRFSDGSQLRFAGGTRGRLVSVTRDGARVRLFDGEVEASVLGTSSSWEFDLGPYALFAGAGDYTAVWREREQSLELCVRSGKVSVEGPLANEGITAHAGQLLSIRKPEGEIVVRSAAAREPAAAAVVSPEPATPSWTELLSEGKFDLVVAQAEARGLEYTLANASSAELLTLADAARFTNNNRIAEQALRAERARFPGSTGANDAAFLLGQIYEADAADSSEAESWYERYLAEASGGAYTAEALGRKLLMVERRSGRAGAAPVAREYLDRFPDGAHAKAAQAILAD
jgi:TolA-binding protein